MKSVSRETFERVGPFARGYKPEEVDDFLAKAQAAYADPNSTEFDAEKVASVAFTPVRGGYRADAVDAALDRLASAFVQRKRTQIVARLGEDTWLNQTYDLAKTLYPRILRPAGERFRDARGMGYDKDQVDALLDRLARFFDGQEPLTSSEIRHAVFSSAKNAAGYDTAVVDVYLERAVAVLTAVE